MIENFTLVVEKWQIRPTPCWILLKEQPVFGRATPKRITLTQGVHKGKVFDRATGADVSRKYLLSMYRYSLKVASLAPRS